MKLQRLLSIATLFVATAALSAQSAPAPAASQKSAPATASKSAAAASPSAAASKGSPLDINTATADQLKQLPGIGDAYSKRIIDGRPYAAKTQLLSRGILPKATYDGVANQIIAKHAK